MISENLVKILFFLKKFGDKKSKKAASPKEVAKPSKSPQSP